MQLNSAVKSAFSIVIRAGFGSRQSSAGLMPAMGGKRTLGGLGQVTLFGR